MACWPLPTTSHHLLSETPSDTIIHLFPFVPRFAATGLLFLSYHLFLCVLPTVCLSSPTVHLTYWALSSAWQFLPKLYRSSSLKLYLTSTHLTVAWLTSCLCIISGVRGSRVCFILPLPFHFASSCNVCQGLTYSPHWQFFPTCVCRVFLLIGPSSTVCTKLNSNNILYAVDEGVWDWNVLQTNCLVLLIAYLPTLSAQDNCTYLNCVSKSVSPLFPVSFGMGLGSLLWRCLRFWGHFVQISIQQRQ